MEICRHQFLVAFHEKERSIAKSCIKYETVKTPKQVLRNIIIEIKGMSY